MYNDYIFDNPEQRRLVLTETIDKVLEGNSLKDLEDNLIKDYKINRQQAHTFLVSVKNEIARVTSQQAELIIPFHLDIYEQIFKYFEEVDFIPGKLKSMRFKEKLMGLHKEDRTVEINNKQTVVIEKEIVYNINRLDQNEQSRLQTLLNKAK